MLPRFPDVLPHQLLCLVAFVAEALACSNLGAQSVAPTGCYNSHPALTYSATGTPERRDTSWAILELRTDGRARRPLLREFYDNRSSWRLASDTLHIIVSDGLAGWRLALTATADGWSGQGHYLSDAIVNGKPWSTTVDFSLHRRPCVPAAPPTPDSANRPTVSAVTFRAPHEFVEVTGVPRPPHRGPDART